MLSRIWRQLVELRADVRLLARLVEVLLDRVTESTNLSTAEACRYADCSATTLRKWRREGILRGENGRWSRADLQLIRRAQVVKAVEQDG